ncbi:MAG: hypothetical protein ABSB15_11500 [Bryobacteraceae bacterium]
MRKFFMILTLAVSFLAVTGVASTDMPGGPPQCSPNCPFGN